MTWHNPPTKTPLKIQALLLLNDSMPIDGIERLVPCSRRSANTYLAKLQKQGKIEKVWNGSIQHVHYRIKMKVEED